MAYMMDPMAEAYGISFMRSVSAAVVGHCDLLNTVPCDIGRLPFLEAIILNLDNTLVLTQANQSVGSIPTDLDSKNLLCFAQVLHLQTTAEPLFD